MIPIVVQPEVIKELADCIVDVIQNKIDWDSIDWQAVAENQRKNDWIPVSERLPEECGYYLVTTDESYNAVIDIAEYGKFFRKPENEYVLEWNKASRVIAWQPLPEPYKKGGEQE